MARRPYERAGIRRCTGYVFVSRSKPPVWLHKSHLRRLYACEAAKRPCSASDTRVVLRALCRIKGGPRCRHRCCERGGCFNRYLDIRGVVMYVVARAGAVNEGLHARIQLKAVPHVRGREDV
jgi:hypothetical protein